MCSGKIFLFLHLSCVCFFRWDERADNAFRCKKGKKVKVGGETKHPGRMEFRKIAEACGNHMKVHIKKGDVYTADEQYPAVYTRCLQMQARKAAKNSNNGT